MNKNKFISNIFIITIFFFLINITISVVISLKNKSFESIGNKGINYKKIFPFDNEKRLDNNFLKKNNIYKTILLKYQYLSKVLKRIDKSVSSRVPFRYKLCEFHGFLSKLIGINLFPDLETIELEKGYLCLIRKYNLSEPLNNRKL